jgi:hypothetical protein
MSYYSFIRVDRLVTKHITTKLNVVHWLTFFWSQGPNTKCAPSLGAPIATEFGGDMTNICLLKSTWVTFVEKKITNTCKHFAPCNCMFSIWKMNELSFIDELDEIENQFILFVKMVSIIHWFGSPKKTVTKIYSYG